jgi:hypothetical protein
MDYKIPIFSLNNGWLLLSYTDKPICLWINNKEIKEVTCSIDERLFGDTLFRVEYLNGTYIICDMFMYNSCCIFAGTTFKQRYDWIEKLMVFFHNIPTLDKIIHKSQSNFDCIGYEYHSNNIGSYGSLSNLTKIIKSDIPDVYFIDGTDNYIQVPNIKTSEYLRSLGDSFSLDIEEKDGLWFIKNSSL